MRFLTASKSIVSRLAFAVAIGAAAAAAQATVITFETANDLSDNFTIDVFPGDSGTEIRPGYGSQSGYDASSGNFVHFNRYDSPNSLRFTAGPVFLNGFTISSQFAFNGTGATHADDNGRDYTLELYDDGNALIHSATMLVGARGSWDEVTLNVAGVRTLRILGTWSAFGVYDGWWPNIDNIRVNEPVQAAVPEPGALALALTALGGLALTRRRRAAAR